MTGAIQACIGEIASGAAGVLSAPCRFPATFAGFQGHFPGHPVLPGVCLVQTATAVLSLHRRQPVLLLRVISAKWLRPVLPDMPLLLTVTERAAGPDGPEFTAVFRHDNERIAELRLCIADAPANGRGGA